MFLARRENVSLCHISFLFFMSPSFSTKTLDVSYANSTSCIELLVHHDQIKPAASVIKPSKAMLSTVCVFVAEDGRDRFQRGRLMVCRHDSSIMCSFADIAAYCRKAYQSRREPVKIPAFTQINCGGTCWSSMRKPEGSQFLLDKSRLDLQVF